MGLTAAVTRVGIRDHRLRLAQPPDDVRRRALARLYERRTAVDQLIGALERYQQEQLHTRKNQKAFSAVEKSS
jgi:hypothetical protein